MTTPLRNQRQTGNGTRIRTLSVLNHSIHEGNIQSDQIDPLHLNTDPSLGLTDDVVISRRQRYGKNVLEEIKEKTWKKIAKNFYNPIAILIEIAIVLVAILGSWLDVGILVGLLLLNAFVHIFHEWKAESIVAALKDTLALHARVRRNSGIETVIPSSELVPGDIFFVDSGDVVPADGKIVSQDVFLLVDQSTLTGESLSVEKRDKDILLSTTSVKRGSAWSIVTGTGKNTFVGRTATLVGFTNVSDSYSRVLSDINNFIIVSDFFICFIILTVALFRRQPLIMTLELIIILTVASLPIALPAVLTVTMAVGAKTLAKKDAIVTRLASVEALASVDILCTDKTGTLTLNTLTLHAPYIFTERDMISRHGTRSDAGGEESEVDMPESDDEIITMTRTRDTTHDRLSILTSDNDGAVNVDDVDDGAVDENAVYDEDDEHASSKRSVELPYIKELLLCAALASERNENIDKMDSIDRAILTAFHTYHIPISQINKWQVLSFVPFDPVNKRVEAKLKNMETGDVMTVTKGAPQIIKHLILGGPPRLLSRYEKVVDTYANRGFRSIGVAKKVNGNPWQLLGIIPLFDPPRPDSLSTLHGAKKLGLSIKMLTGDALAIAKETARRLGMGTAIYDSNYISMHDKILPDTDESEKIERADGFSQIYPEHKYIIVDALQKRGHVVAVSGDGQNDSAALKKADVGIAVHGAVDSARAAASIVFLKPGLSVILDAIRISRKIFARMYGYAIYRITHSLHLLLIVAFLYIAFLFWFSPKLLIILAIFSDVSVLLIGLDHASSSPLPEKWNLHELFVISFVLSLILTLGTIIFYLLLLANGLPLPVIVSLLFLQVALTENQLIFSTRLRSSFFGRPYPSPWLAVTVISVDIAATLFVILGFAVPARASLLWVAQTWLYSLGVFFILDIAKCTTRGIILKRQAKRLARLKRRQDIALV